MARKVLTQNLSEPLCNASTAKVDVDVADGNLTIDPLTGDEPLLANGTLEYVEGQELSNNSVNTGDGQAILVLKAKSTGRVWLRLPWDACNAATHWQIHLNPNVRSDISAHSGGGNLKLNLASMVVTRVSADTGGGNLDLVLPEHASDLDVSARTGAGNVVIHVPSGIAVKVQATTGLGKVIADSRFNKMDGNLYQSPDYEVAGEKAEITAHSGAGNITIETR
jgi:hypothetical protein